MTKDQEIEKLEDRKRQIDVEVAYLKGELISYKHKRWHYYEKYNTDHPKFEWDSFDYIVTPEPKQIPFDGSDSVRLIGSKFKFKHYCLYRIALDVDNERVYFRDSDITYEELADDYEIWNDLLNKFEPCTKVG